MVNFLTMVRATPDKHAAFLNKLAAFRYKTTLGEGLGCGCDTPGEFFPLIRPIVFYDISIVDKAGDALAREVLQPHNSAPPFKIPDFIYNRLPRFKKFRGEAMSNIEKLPWEQIANLGVSVLGERIDKTHEHVTGTCPSCKKPTTEVWG